MVFEEVASNDWTAAQRPDAAATRAAGRPSIGCGDSGAKFAARHFCFGPEPTHPTSASFPPRSSPYPGSLATLVVARLNVGAENPTACCPGLNLDVSNCQNW